MLYGDVEVLAYLGLLFYDVDELLRDLVLVAIHEADPLDAVYAADIPDQIGEHALPVGLKVLSVSRHVLGDDHDLLDAGRGELPEGLSGVEAPGLGGGVDGDGVFIDDEAILLVGESWEWINVSAEQFSHFAVAFDEWDESKP